MVKIKRIIKQWKINNGNGMLKKYLINQKKGENTSKARNKEWRTKRVNFININILLLKLNKSRPNTQSWRLRWSD